MHNLRIPFLRRFLNDDKGQTAAVVLVVIFGLTAMSVASIETGHVYYASRLLQASTNAAALAAGQAMPNIGTSSSPVVGTAYYALYQYSSQSGELNANSLLKSASITATYNCSTTATDLDAFCEVPTTGACSGSAKSCNEVTVAQTATVPLWFGGLVGMSKMTITATAQASMAGGHPPYNIAVVIDTTASMEDAASSNDDCPSGSQTQIGCAVYGLKTMLMEMYPCIGNGTCSTDSYADSVALYTFPAVEVTSSTNYASNDTTCPTSNPNIVPYGFEDLTTSTLTSNLYEPTPTSTFPYVVQVTSGKTTTTVDAGGTYQIEPFENTYKTTDLGTLTGTDGLVIASGGGGGTCKGLQAPGGEATYYAQVIQEAQADLASQKSYMWNTYQVPTQNVMIILSDGDATACNSQVSTTVAGCTSTTPSEIVAANCPAVTLVSGKPTCGSTTISINGGSATLACPTAGCSGLPLSGTGTATTNPPGTITGAGCYGYNCPAYPSAVGECGQAVWAAQQATAAGTIVYTVAMGSETSGSCLTDSTYSLSNLTDGAATWTGKGAQACTAIAAMASSASTFYSDYSGGCKAISQQNQTFESMAGIFEDVAKRLSTSRLIPTGSN